MNKRWLWFVIVALVLAGAYSMSMAARPKGTPEGQIRGAIMDSVQALNDGRVGEAMRIVSSEYKDSMNNRDRLYLMARQAAQNRQYWDAVVQSVRPEVNGDEATVPLVVAVHRTERGGVYQHALTLRFRREKAHAYGVFPTTRWKMVGASDLPTEGTVFNGD